MAGLMYDLEAYDAQHYGRTYMFKLTIPKVANVELAVASVSGLNYQLGVLTTNWKNEPAKMALRPESVGEISLVVHDNVEKQVAENLWKWFKEVYDPATRNLGYPSTYKCDGELEQLTTKGEHIRTWQLQGIWPSGFDMGEFSYEGDEIVSVTVTLQVDRVVLS